jgi:CHAD domain-containing protein
MQPGVRREESVGEALVAFANDILAEAQAALDNPQNSDAVAVHDFRKAMKRWRALLRLLEPRVGEPARELRVAARELARELAAARDGQSALDALADVAKAGAKGGAEASDEADDALSARSMGTIRGRLEALRESAEATTLTETLRARLRTLLEAAHTALAEWGLEKVKFNTVAAALSVGYGRARSAIPKQWPDADSEELHELRQRVVVHRYQMELVEPLWPRLGKLWTAEAQRLRERLGTCQDLAVLASLTSTHQPLAPWRSRLGPRVAGRPQMHEVVAERIAGRLFAEKPRAFRRRLLALRESGGGADD